MSTMHFYNFVITLSLTLQSALLGLIPSFPASTSLLCASFFLPFWNFVEHGIMQHVVFSNLPALFLTSSYWGSSVLCVSAVCFFSLKAVTLQYSLCECSAFYLLFSWESFGLFPVWDCWRTLPEPLHIHLGPKPPFLLVGNSGWKFWITW